MQRQISYEIIPVTSLVFLSKAPFQALLTTISYALRRNFLDIIVVRTRGLTQGFDALLVQLVSQEKALDL